MRVAALILVLAALLASAIPPASAQGCSQCKTAAAALGEEPGKALDQAILILLLPTVSIFVGVLAWAVRRRDRSWTDEAEVADLPFSPDDPTG